MKKRICILAFSPVRSDARVLRQVEYLEPHFDLSVIGDGERPPGWGADVTWHPVTRSGSFRSRLTTLLLLLLGRFVPRLYELWYWQKRHHRQALTYVMDTPCDAIHANDWNTLPIAVRGAAKHHAQVVFDAHEYAPLEHSNQRFWRHVISPMVTYFLRRYSPQVDVSMTVSPPLARRYYEEFNLTPHLILNAPKPVTVADHAVDPDHIRLIHHGAAVRNRRLESMIEAMRFCEARFSLHFMLTGEDTAYIDELHHLAEKTAPTRIVFHPPVPPGEIVQRISEFDVGLCMIEPSNFSTEMSLPNKFFDFMAAGLAICCGPSPAMADIIRQTHCGIVTTSFHPEDAGAALNTLDGAAIVDLRRAARQAATIFNADHEMGKLVELYTSLIAN